MAVIHVTDATLQGQLTGSEYTGPVEQGATFTGDVIYQDAPNPPNPEPAPDDFWTAFVATTPSGEGSSFSGAGTRKIYVAAKGNDNNTGSQTSPKKTIAAGVAQLRSGKPDWLLLNKGDVWSDQQLSVTSKAGKSATEPMLIGAYGTGARPSIQFVRDEWEPVARFTSCSNVFVVGLDFYAYKRDPDNPSFKAGAIDGERSNAHGFSLEGSGSNFTLEDCMLRFYRTNLSCIGPYDTVALRRCVILDAYDWQQPSSGNTQGVFFSYSKNNILEQCILDGNGHNDQLGHTPIMLSHASYFRQPNSQGNGTTGPGTVTGCWISRNSADGGGLRRGGSFTRNLSTLHANGFDIGHNKDDAEGGAITSSADVSDNVIVRSQNVSAGRTGHGMCIISCESSGVKIHNNIVAHLHPNARHTGGGAGAIWAQPIYLEKCKGINVTDNIIYDWPTDDNRAVYDAQSGGGNAIDPNAVDMAGANTARYPDPARTLGSYYASIGGANDEVALINAVRRQSKDNWDDRLTAKAVINYIRAGFNMKPV